MAERSVQKKLVYEGAAGRYRALMMKTRDPDRRRMLEEMIARELEARRRRDFISALMNKKWLGSADIGSL